MRWDDRILVVIGLMAMQFAPAGAAQAHTAADVMPAHWNATTAPWRFTQEVPQNMRAAVQAAAGAWGNLGRNFSFPFTAGNDAANFNSQAGGNCDPAENTIHWQALDGVPLPPTPNTLANARTCVTNGIATRFTITIDSGDTFDTGVDTAWTGQSDLVSVLVHEFGHATGRTGGINQGHYAATDAICTAGITIATMCPSLSNGRAFRTLEPHDVHTFAAQYTGSNTYCGFTVYGGFRDKYVANGTNNGVFGCPTVEEYDVNDGGRREDFAGGNMTFHPSIGVFAVKNAIASRWRALGATGWGFPMIDETLLPDGQGYHNHFRKLGGPATSCGQNNDRSIYWHPQTGAHGIEGAIRERWCALGWEGNVGYPVTSESVTPDGVGRYNHFLKIGQAATCSTSGNASIYWRAQTGAHLVKGGIRQRWCQIGWEGGVVGYPTTSETPTPVRTGAFNHFRKLTTGGSTQYDASIYWSPATGAWEVYSTVRTKWSSLGWEGGVLGFPWGTRANVSTGFQQRFEFGAAYAATSSGTVRALWGPIYNRYVTQGGPSGTLGFPVTDVYTPVAGAPGDQQADFQTGSIRYIAATNTTVVCPVRC